MSYFLITGGAGFIGSHLAEAFIARGHRVRVLDDFSTGKRSNLAHLEGRVEVIEGSIVDGNVCRAAAHGVDYVLHEAALASVPRSVADPAGTNAVNVDGTLNMLIAARDAGVKRFVFAASSAAYGNIDAPEKSEDLPPSPLSPYAAQKLSGELYGQVFHRLYGLETVSLRYFNVFGPRQDPNSQYAAVVPKFITMMLAGEPPIIDGDGGQSRDFTFVENVVHANWLACTAPSAVAGQVVNAACGERIGVKQLAQCIREILGCDVAAVHGPARAGDVKHSLASLAKARALLGYEPVVPFAEGIRRTVAWYQSACA